jgi:PHS family inorganic phosphate transporter-like MFS transporter
LGVGVGGKYPLAGTVSAESTKKSKSAIEIAFGFFWQTPGAMLPYAVGMALLAADGLQNETSIEKHQASFDFRLLLGLGALPALAVVILTYLQPSSSMVKFDQPNIWNVIKDNPHHWRVLIGTGGSWFFYDFLYYGTALNQPLIIEAVFGNADTIYSNLWQNLVVSSVGIPGVIVAIAVLPKLGAKRLQAWGFILLAIICGCMALVNFIDPLTNSSSTNLYSSTSNPWIQFGMLCVLIFSLNWGPNVSTYVLPPQSFPPQVRSSFFGISAAFGKLGALVGGFCFPLLADAVGYGYLFIICSVLSLAGLLLTHIAIKPYNHNTLLASSHK